MVKLCALERTEDRRDHNIGCNTSSWVMLCGVTDRTDMKNLELRECWCHLWGTVGTNRWIFSILRWNLKKVSVRINTFRHILIDMTEKGTNGERNSEKRRTSFYLNAFLLSSYLTSLPMLWQQNHDELEAMKEKIRTQHFWLNWEPILYWRDRQNQTTWIHISRAI